MTNSWRPLVDDIHQARSRMLIQEYSVFKEPRRERGVLIGRCQRYEAVALLDSGFTDLHIGAPRALGSPAAKRI